MRRGLPILLLALVPLLAACGGSADESAGTTSVAVTTTAPGGCADVATPSSRDGGGATVPTERLDPERTYTLVFLTNCGSFTIELDLALASATAASLVSLARSGYYDDTIFHRIVPGFVIQGGDPTQSGSGGPGYQTVDPPPADATYGQGVVAMAKSQDEPPGTSGSQFFVVTAEDAGLPPEYAIVGRVTSGLDVVERIGVLGDESQQPTRTVAIETVKVEEQ